MRNAWRKKGKIVKRRRYIVSLCAILGLPLAGATHSSAVHAQQTVQQGPTATPVTVNVRTLPVVASSHGALPFRHPSGAAALAAARQIAPSIAPRTGIQNAQSTSTASSPSSGSASSFDGIDYSQSSCGCYPPDGAIAAGPTYVVASVNTAYQVFAKSGKAQLGSPISLGSLFAQNSGCQSNDSDPGVAYDSANQRYLVEALTYNNRYSSTICIAVTTASDVSNGTWSVPSSWTWTVYAFPVTSSATRNDLLDYPRLGLTSDAIMVGGNQFYGGSTWGGPRVYAYNKTQMYAGQTANSVYVDNIGTQYDTLTPARGNETSSTAYLIAADNSGSSGSTVNLWKWTDPFGSTAGSDAWTYQGAATVTTYSAPINPPEEGGGTLDAGDLREMGAYYYQGTIYGSHDISCNPSGGSTTVDCIQWYQIGNLDSTPIALQQGIYGATDGYRFYPNLVVDSSGNLLMGYDFSSNTDYPGVRYTGRLATDTADALGTESTLVAGQANANGGRWGDYSGTFLDPSDNCTAWHLGEYAESGQLWGTRIGSFSFCQFGSTSGSLSFTTNPQTLTAGQPSGALSVSAAAGTTVTFSSSDTTTGGFSTTNSGPFPTGSLSVTVPSGGSTATVYYEDTKAGTPTITATATGYTTTSQSETVNAGPLATITVNPATTSLASGQSTTITASGADQYGNSVTVDPAWSDSLGGSFSPATGQSTTFTAGSTAGTDTITATETNSANTVITGTATVDITTAVAPSAPTNLTATPHHWVNLSWSDSQSGVTFNVYRSTTGVSGPFDRIASGVTTTSYTDKTSAGDSYYVTAVNSAGVESSASNIAQG